MKDLKVISSFEPAGSQPEAINKLVSGLNDGLLHQTLLGVTGSGKTYTMAKVIEETPVSYTHLTLPTIFRV